MPYDNNSNGISMDYAANRRIPSESVISRLPRYYRVLRELLGEDIYRISSTSLATLLKTSASQIRSDLSYFGEFGQQGYGYNVRLLFSGISSALGVTDDFGAVILGTDSMARALASDPLFLRRGVILRGMFGNECSENGIFDISALDSFLSSTHAEIIVLCDMCGIDIPKLSGICARHGLLGIWNFTSNELTANDFESEIEIKNVFISDSLMTLCYNIKKRQIGAAYDAQTYSGSSEEI